MKFDEVYSLFNSTFGSKKNDDESFYAFRRMLHEFGIIDDELYLSLSIDDGDRSQNESRSYSYCYIVTEGDIPSFEDFYSNNFGFKSDIIRIMSGINHVIITNENGDSIYYNKIDNQMGLPVWEKNDGDSKIIEIDSPEMTSIICKYVVEMQYNYKIIDDYLNINVAKFSTNDNELSDLLNMFSDWYKKIFDVDNIEDGNWPKFISFIEEAGIISSLEKSRILSDSTAASF